MEFTFASIGDGLRTAGIPARLIPNVETSRAVLIAAVLVVEAIPTLVIENEGSDAGNEAAGRPSLIEYLVNMNMM